MFTKHVSLETLSLSCCRVSVVTSWSCCRATHGFPTVRLPSSLRVPWVSCLDPRGCPRVQDDPVTKSQPLCVFVGVVASCVLCARVPRVLRDVLTTGCISCATENTYAPPRLEALFQLSVVIILRHVYRSLQQFCGCTQNPSTCSTRSFLFETHRFSLLVVGSVAIHFVYENANLFIYLKIDQRRMLSRLSLDFTATGIHAVLHVSCVTSIFDCNHCDLRDARHAVLRLSGVVSIFDCFQSAKLQKNWSIPTGAAVFPHETSVICSVVRLWLLMRASVALFMYRFLSAGMRVLGYLFLNV